MAVAGLYCGKWRKISKSRHDLDLGPAMPNIELFRDIFIYYVLLKFYIHRSITSRVIAQKTRKHRNTETHKDSDEYSIVAFCKKATAITTWNIVYSVLSIDPNASYLLIAIVTKRKRQL